MHLTSKQRGWLDDVGRGIADSEAFMAELTDYHGGGVATEYLLTTDIARALLRRSHPELGVEYLINRIEKHALIRDRSKPFTLGSRRFDVAILETDAPVVAIEVKVRVRSLHPHLARDLDKILACTDFMQRVPAQNLLGACVFQVHVTAARPSDVAGTTSCVQAVEDRIRAELTIYAGARHDCEFAWVEFQPPGGRVHDDEETSDVDEAATPMLGRLGYACRYHAILVRRSAATPWTGPIATLPFHGDHSV